MIPIYRSYILFIFLRLSLRLANKPWLSTTDPSEGELFYQADEDLMQNLHPAQYDERFIRLACAIVHSNKIEWNTLCLSDYIRPSMQTST